MRHIPFVLIVALYVVLIGQNWSIYTAAILITLYRRQGGRWNSRPFTIG